MTEARPETVLDWTGRTLELEVGAVAHGGHCVARYDGRVVFVRHALPGEVVEAAVTEDHGKAFCRADAVRVLRPAAGRVEAPCALAGPGRCGGCDWQHATPELQRELKARVVAEQLSRLAGIERAITVEQLPGGPLGWRTRLRLAVGADGRAGLHVHRAHEVVPLDEAGGCAISVPGLVDDVLDRRWRRGGELELTLDGAGRRHLREVNVVRGRKLSRQLGGGHDETGAGDRGRAEEYAAGRTWRFDARGFWQGHRHAAETLADVVGGWAAAPAGATVWDLYAGIGLFAAVLADQVGDHGRVVAVEADRHAVADGRANLADCSQVRWELGGVERRLAALEARDEPGPAVVCLDPPRKGAGHPVVEAIARRHPDRVVYVACDPAALARDVATFAERGYALSALRAFDAFPMTHHVECVALLEPS